MKNKQHEYIIRAFLKSAIPSSIKENATQLIMLDAYIGGYCTQLISNRTNIKLHTNSIISSEEKEIFSRLINKSDGKQKSELIIYYRLMVLVEAVLLEYSC